MGFANAEMIRVSRFKMGLLAAAGGACLACASWSLLIGQADWKAGGAGLFGAIILTVGSGGVFRPPHLRLDGSSLTIVGSFGSPTVVAWREVEQFKVWKIGQGSEMLVYVLKPGSPLKKRAGVLFDGFVGSGWPKSPSAMAQLLNERRAAALAG